MSNRNASEVLTKHLGFCGMMLSGSKADYERKNPDNIVYFNANIYGDGMGKLWYGDIDVTENSFQLIQAQKEIGVTLYILKELDGRFDKENRQDYAKVAEITISDKGIT